MRKPRQNVNCPYCLSPIETGKEIVRCPKCGVIHHAECWQANGSCSVYGCDGWAVWNESITNRIAPDMADKVDVTGTDTASREAKVVRCIECGEPVSPKQMVCWECRRARKPRLFESCFGPAVLFLCGTVGIVWYGVKLLL